MVSTALHVIVDQTKCNYWTELNDVMDLKISLLKLMKIWEKFFLKGYWSVSFSEMGKELHLCTQKTMAMTL